MRAGVVRVLLSVVCLVGGGLLWMTGRVEQRIVRAERALFTMNDDGHSAGLEDLERSTAPIGGVPWIGGVRQAIAEQRAQASYWKHDYAALPAGDKQAEATGVSGLLAANAAFRRLKLDGSDARAVEKLQEVATRYAELLRDRPELVEAAYNYEFVTRTRETLARARGSRAPRRAEPPTRSIHGEQGATPTATDMGDFKVIIPQNPQERQQRPESGAGGAKVRKG